MTRLNSEQVLQDHSTQNADSVRELYLNHKALTDVSCLGNFKNLEKLDLKLNNLTSLEGLKSCVNLKWLCVVENKLETLEGVQGLSKLLVLNAGKNKLKSMDPVKSLVSLCALILNDNEISSLCKLDQMKDLNTLVLSKNPIRKIGDALVKLKSITKLSLSFCQLESIDHSFKFCAELKELRLAHNDIKSLPNELAHNSKLLNLDLGNNVIMSWSDLKIVTSLKYLRNLNLQGNPIATNDKLARKIRKALPKLRIFNAKLIDQHNEKEDRIDESDQSILAPGSKKLERQKDSGAAEGKNNGKRKNEEWHFATGEALNMRKKSSKKKKTGDHLQKNENATHDEKGSAQDDFNRFEYPSKNNRHDGADFNMQKKTTKVKERKVEKDSDVAMVLEAPASKVDKKRKKQRERDYTEVDVLDNADASFTELFETDNFEDLRHGNGKPYDKAIKTAMTTGSGSVGVLIKQNLEFKSFPLVDEIGQGGPSTWGED